jgi:hypothetical protein
LIHKSIRALASDIQAYRRPRDEPVLRVPFCPDTLNKNISLANPPRALKAGGVVDRTDKKQPAGLFMC